MMSLADGFSFRRFIDISSPRYHDGGLCEKKERAPRGSGWQAKAVSKGSPHPQPRPPKGGAVLAAGRARESGAAKLCLAGALRRRAGFGRLKGSLRRAAPALDPSKSTHSKFKRG
jgi:hypothetical protein